MKHYDTFFLLKFKKYVRMCMNLLKLTYEIFIKNLELYRHSHIQTHV